MKNTIRIIGIVAFIAIIGFTMAACGGGDGIVTAKFKFSGNRSGGRSLVTENVMQNTVVIQGTEDFGTFYNHLGKKKGTITPTSMELAICDLLLWKLDDGVAHMERLIGVDARKVDFANPVVLTFDKIEAGNYVFVSFSFQLLVPSGMDASQASTITFPKPAGFNFATHAYNTLFIDKMNEMENPTSAYIVEERGINIFGDLNVFTPRTLYSDYKWNYYSTESPQLPDLTLGQIQGIYMGGNKHWFYDWTGDNVLRMSDVVPGLPNEGNLGTGLIVPFKGINIPDDAEAVRFEIYWNIENIIEHYEGLTASPDDDLFVLKNGFWNDFSIQAFIE